MTRRPVAIHGLAELATRYDAFLLDQYGVLHDGTRPYAGVHACLRELAAARKRVAVVSNSAKRSEFNRARLARLGVPLEGIECVMTSGEAFLADLAPGRPLAAKEWRHVFVIASDEDRSLLVDAPLVEVARLERADVLLLLGIAPPRLSTATLAPLLEEALHRGLELVCANPDHESVTAGGNVEGPGQVALRYEALGGKVLWYGKPWPAIFEAALAALGCADRRRALMVGDAITHDVRGARAAGIDSVLVLGGVHRGQSVARICQGAEAIPDFVLPELRW